MHIKCIFNLNQGKVRKIENSDEPLPVPDPYFGRPEEFGRCFDLIERGDEALIEQEGD
jgi:protein-tyrosine-phosphatase